MPNNATFVSRLLQGILYAVLFAITGLASCGGSVSSSDDPSDPNTPPPVPTPAAIADVAAEWAATAYRSGTITHYCDCGTGAEIDCQPGADGNSGTAASPKQTIASAIATLNAAASGETVALCQGGAFDALSGFNITRSGCAVGTTCVDLREYAPTTFPGTAKPIINHPTSGTSLFTVNGNLGGVRFLNLTLNGNNGVRGNDNAGFFFYDGAHDVIMGNLDMNNFDTAVYNAGGNPGVVRTSNIKLTGSRITNSRTMGFLGAGINADISYNYWDGNGSSDSREHTIYLSAAQHVTNMQLVGNYVRGQYGPTCLGAPIVAHVAVDGLLVAYNTVEIDAAETTSGCWGIEFDNVTGDPDAVYHRRATFSGNTVINGGNRGLTITTCPDCIIENNIIVQDWPYSFELMGINVPSQAAKIAQGDDVNTRNIIRNNTVWFGPNTLNGGIGIRVGLEGIGHIVANNTVYFGATSGGSQGIDCYDYGLALTDYAFINNNHCYSAAASYEWVNGRGSLASWQTYATARGFDSASIEGDAPMFTAVGTDFTPGAGSPLIGAGSNANKSTLDITGATRPSPPAIGAFEP
ncbi:MAG: hypothetical protein KJ795_14765 [Gammaproteobacteria bacterium]|nr:hypothetical protein [Gammaproteobacteria bacterium]MBU1968437.1 hypothetical protein [Gammaproteobacteria bacterium]